MNITINGKKETVNNHKSLLTFVEEKGLDEKRVVVEVNLKIISQEDLANTLIQEGDSIEIVSFVTGG